jgi:type VI protein secretion system component Hcp
MAYSLYISFEGARQGKILAPSPAKGINMPGNQGLFEIEDYSFDIEQTLNIGSSSSGAGAGKVTFNPFSITKQTDTASPAFFQQAMAGGSSGSGSSSGKRQHKPIVITKEIDSASPKLAQALLGKEILRTVKISFSRVEPGRKHPWHTIVLTNALITRINRVLIPSTKRPGEKIELAFEKATNHSGFLS